MSFRLKILLTFFLLFVISGITLSLFFIKFPLKGEKESTLKHITANSIQILDDLDHFIKNYNENMKAMGFARIWTEPTASVEMLNERLVQYRNTFKAFDRISLLSPDGIILADSEGLEIGSTYAESPKTFCHSKNEFKIVSSEDRLYNELLYCYQKNDPKYKNQRFLVARTPFHRIHHLVRGYSIFEIDKTNEIEVELLNSDGTVLFSNFHKNQINQRSIHWDEINRILHKMIQAKENHIVLKNLSSTRIITLLPSERSRSNFTWISHVIIPEALLSRETSKTGKTLIYIGLCLGIISGIVLWLVSGQLTHPLLLLTQNLKQIESGNFKILSPLQNRTDEFKILSNGLIEMSKKIESSLIELRESEKRWSLALEGGQWGVWDWNPKTNEVYYSPRWKLMLGYGINDITPAPSEWFDRVHPEDLPQITEKIKNFFSGNSQHYFSKFRMKCKNGEYKWMIARGLIAERNFQNEITRFIGTHEDISQQIEMEKKVKESEQKFKTLADFTHDWEYWVSPENKIIYSSPSSERILGYSAEFFLNKINVLSNIIHPDDRERHEQHLRFFHCDTNPNDCDEIEFRFLHKNGSTRWIGHVCRPIYSDAGTYLGRRISNRDITTRKQAEEKFRALFEYSSDALLISDTQGKITDANPTALQRYQNTLNQLKEKFIYQLSIHSEQSAYTRHLQELNQQKEISFLTTHLSQDGAIIPTEILARSITLSDKPHHIYFCRDITERDKILSELRNTAESRSQLLKEINHRVKNNLIAIQGLIIHELEHAKIFPAIKTEKTLENLERRVEGLLQAHQLLSESKWNAIPISQLAEKIIESASTTIPNQIKLLTFIETSPIEASPRQASPLALIFNELTTNSIKYAIRPGQPLEISISVAQELDFIRIEYRDNGPGYPQSVIQKKDHGVGLKLMHQLMENTLRGSLKLANDGGALTILRIRTEERTRT